jgi:hypothetical protein
MGLLDDAIREHLDLKRRRGADPGEVEKMEREALGPVRREPMPSGMATGYADPDAHDEPGDVAGTESHYDEDATQLHNLDGLPTDFTEIDAGEHDVPHDVGDWGSLHGEAPPQSDAPADLELEHHDEPAPRRRGLLRRRAAASEREHADAEREAFLAGLGGSVTPEPTVEHPATDAPESEEPPPLEFESSSQRARAAEPELELEPAPAEPEIAESDQPSPEPENMQETAAHDVAAELAAEDHVAQSEKAPPEDDVLEETPDFLQDTPEHDRLWFEQKPPKDFDFDD